MFKILIKYHYRLIYSMISYLAVCAVLGVRIACSIVPGLPPWVPGLKNPLKGLPDWVVGLILWLGPPELVVGLLNDVPGPTDWILNVND